MSVVSWREAAQHSVTLYLQYVLPSDWISRTVYMTRLSVSGNQGGQVLTSSPVSLLVAFRGAINPSVLIPPPTTCWKSCSTLPSEMRKWGVLLPSIRISRGVLAVSIRGSGGILRGVTDISVLKLPTCSKLRSTLLSEIRSWDYFHLLRPAPRRFCCQYQEIRAPGFNH